MIKCLSLGPGSMGFFLELGILSKLDLDSLEEISGSSAGALLAFFFLVTRGDFPKILDYALKAPLKQIMTLNVRSLLTNYGMIPLQKIRDQLHDATRTFLGKSDVTFQELYDFWPIKLHVAGYCVDLQKTQYFSVDTTPGMKLVDALCASVAVPLLVSTVVLDGWTYIDGGVEEEDPCACYLGRPSEDVLKVRVTLLPGVTPVRDYKSYLMNMLSSLMKMRYRYPEFRAVEIGCDGVDLHDFCMSSETKLKLFLAGHAHKIPDSY
jgi:predicted acylesterase/phospholipase RssA